MLLYTTYGVFLVRRDTLEYNNVQSDAKNSMDNNPMVGATVTVAAAVEEAQIDR